MEEEKGTLHSIDIGLLAKKLYSRRRLFYIVWPVTFVVACFIILSVPRYYTSDARLAPEMAGSNGGGMLGSLASSFGINLGGMETSDAINPMLYPDLMEDNSFATAMFPVRVQTIDGEVNTDYYTYLTAHQKAPWWSSVMKAVNRWMATIMPGGDEEEEWDGSAQPSATNPQRTAIKNSPYWLTKREDGKAETVRGNIHISVNEKTGTIGIQTRAQDPLIAKILADSVQAHLQQFITEYRTNKARIDVDHYEKLARKARHEYDSICRVYMRYTEANTHIVRPAYQTVRENLEKDMQMKYTTYTSIMAQLETAKARLQERTPAFTVLKGAAVPLRPAGPKRMLFVLFMLILATVVTATIVLRKELTKTITLS